MTLEVIFISLLLSVIGSLIANSLDKYCEKTYRCDFFSLLYLKAIVTWSCAIERAWDIAHLLVRATKYANGRARNGIIATKDWVIFEAELYRLILESWWAALLDSYSRIKSVAKTGGELVSSVIPGPQPSLFFQSPLVRAALMTMVVIAIALIPPFLQRTHQDPSLQVAENGLPRPRFIGERAFEQLIPGPGEWTYRGATSEDRETRLEIFHNGQKAFSHETFDYLDVVTFSNQAEGAYEGISVEGTGEINTRDITGDRVPDILLVENCGCSAGFVTYTLVSLGQQVKETFTTNEWLGEMQWRLEDVNGDGVYEAVGPEFPIMIREEWYKWSGPSIEVILKYDNGGFTFASDLMRRKPPTRKEFLAQVEKAKRELGDYEIPLDSGSYYTRDLPDSVSKYVINLIYTGNGEMAHEFINLVFSDEMPEQRDFFWRSFYTDLSGKSYWAQIAEMNHWSVDQYILEDTC